MGLLHYRHKQEQAAACGPSIHSLKPIEPAGYAPASPVGRPWGCCITATTQSKLLCAIQSFHSFKSGHLSRPDMHLPALRADQRNCSSPEMCCGRRCSAPGSGRWCGRHLSRTGQPAPSASQLLAGWRPRQMPLFLLYHTPSFGSVHTSMPSWDPSPAQMLGERVSSHTEQSCVWQGHGNGQHVAKPSLT